MVAIEVPANYGYVVLGAAVAPVITSLFFLGGDVMKARKTYGVEYPNL
jgi:hypothetical protein